MEPISYVVLTCTCWLVGPAVLLCLFREDASAYSRADFSCRAYFGVLVVPYGDVFGDEQHPSLLSYVPGVPIMPALLGCYVNVLTACIVVANQCLLSQ